MKIVMPNYDHCILNTITSLLKYYGVESNHKSLEELDDVLGKKQYSKVLLLIMDGMGEHILNNISPDGFFNMNKKTVVTSVYPSTTTAALTTYYAGKPPYETGWIAWSQYFKEFGRAFDVLQQKESYDGIFLKGKKLEVFEEVIKYKSVFEQIKEASPETEVFEITPVYSQRRAYNSITANNIDEITDNVRVLTKLPGNVFMMAYCDNPDSILHKYGTDSEEAKQYLLDTERKIEKMINDLPENTLVVISADHGHKNILKVNSMLDYPEILECLITPPTLESRAMAMWVREDMKEIFEERFNNAFKEEYLLMSREEFLEKNMLGFGEKHRRVDDFIGNYIAISIADSIFKLETYWFEGKNVKKSTHAGLTKEEMEVPVIMIGK